MGAERIPEFWHWWQRGGRAEVTDAVRRADHDAVNGLLRHRGSDFDKTLVFDVRRGTTSEWRLSLSSGGTARGRVMAERWFRAAPAADTAWQYAPARPRDRKVLDREHRFSRHQLVTGDVRITWAENEAEGRYDVRLLHPTLAVMPPDPKAAIVDRILAGLLGEDESIRWVAARTSAGRSPAGRPLGEFADLIAEREAAPPLPERWKHLTGEGVLARLLVRPQWVDAPLLDQLVRIVLPPDDRTTGDELLAALGARARPVAHAAMDEQVVLFLYTDSTDTALTEWIQQWAAERELPVVLRLDPGWTSARTLRLPRADDTDVDLVDDLVGDTSGGGD